MIRPKNFRELKKSIISQNERENQASQILQQNQHGLINQSQRLSFTKMNNIPKNMIQCISQSSNTKLNSDKEERVYGKFNLVGYEQRKLDNDFCNNQSNKINNQQSSYVSPIKRQKSFLSPVIQNGQTYSYKSKEKLLYDNQRMILPNSSNQKQKNIEALKFDSNVKRKLNFNNISQKSIKGINQQKQRLSSNKKIVSNNFSFKSIIQNSPQCKQMESQRIAKKQNSNHKQFSAISPLRQNYKGIQSDRQVQRQSSLTKLKYQFAGIKKMLTKHQSQKQVIDKAISNIFLQGNKSQNINLQQSPAYKADLFSQPQSKFQNISFTKKAVKKHSIKNGQNVSPIVSKIDTSRIIGKVKGSIIMNRTPTNANRAQATRKDLNALFKDKTPLQQRVVLNESFNDLVNMSRQSINSQLDMNPYIY